MSETRFTPGPWMVHLDVPSDTWYVSPVEATVPVNPLDVDPGAVEMDPEYEANARLIAAAPDLYTALEGLYATIRSRYPLVYDMPADVREHLVVARLALAAARGESTPEPT